MTGIRIFKHCVKRFNLALGCKTLQLGTLRYYAEHDPEYFPFADRNEGKRTAELEGPLKVTPELIRLFNSPIRLEGEGRIEVLSGGRLVFDDTAANCYVLSCSLSRENGGVFPRYDSCFEFPNVATTGDALMHLLKEQLTLDDLEGGVLPTNAQLRYLSDRVQYFPVDSFRGGVAEVKRIAENCQAPVFLSKFDTFSNEAEYRFCFFVVNPSKQEILPVKMDPKILHLNSRPGFRPFWQRCKDRT